MPRCAGCRVGELVVGSDDEIIQRVLGVEHLARHAWQDGDFALLGLFPLLLRQLQDVHHALILIMQVAIDFEQDFLGFGEDFF